MILVFSIFIVIILVATIFLLSSIKITIYKVNFLISEPEYNEDNIKFNYELYISLCLFNKIDIIKIKLDKDKIKNLNLKSKIKPQQMEKIKNNIPDKKGIIELIKRLKIKFTKFNLSIEIDTPNLMVTTGSVTVVSTIISIILSKVINKKDAKNYNYKITPLYTNKNILKIDFNCIIKVKIVHIIFIIYYLLYKKRRDDKNERTSNRRSYDYSYE